MTYNNRHFNNINTTVPTLRGHYPLSHPVTNTVSGRSPISLASNKVTTSQWQPYRTATDNGRVGNTRQQPTSRAFVRQGQGNNNGNVRIDQQPTYLPARSEQFELRQVIRRRQFWRRRRRWPGRRRWYGQGRPGIRPIVPRLPTCHENPTYLSFADSSDLRASTENGGCPPVRILSPGEGPARNVAIGGAMGSLGGDLSSLFINPAGLGLYKSRELVITPGMGFNNNHNDFRGTEAGSGLTRFQLGTCGFVWGKPGSAPSSSWKGGAWSLAVTKLADYNNHSYYQGPPTTIAPIPNNMPKKPPKAVNR